MNTPGTFRPMKFMLDADTSVELDAKVIAEVSSAREGAKRWAEIQICVTPSRLYIIQIKGKSSEPGEKTIINTAIVASQKMMAQFLGDGKLAQKILTTLNIKK